MQENSTKVIYFPSHHQLSESEINSYLTQKGMQTRKQGTQISIKVCPFCHPVQNQTDMYALKFTPDTGAYFCHRCRANGSWNDLRTHFGDGPMIGKAWQSRVQQVVQRPMPEPLLADSYPQNLKFVPKAIDTLAQRKISQETLDLYQVGTIPRNFYNEEAQKWEGEDCWTYPLWINSSGRPEIVRYKLRSISNKAHMRLEPTGGLWGLFGLNAVPSQSDTVIIAEGENDAMAIYEQTKIPALSVPNGANSCPDEVVEILKQFSKIYLWFDNDAAGYQGVERYAAKIGRERCLVIPNIDAKDANDALIKGQNLLDNIAKAKPLPHENILHISDLRDALYSEFANPEAAKGVRATSLPQFSDALGGLRMGEVTLLSGVTGGGKCLGKDTPVMMADGSVKPVQDIRCGEQVMGPDSKPRNVLSTTSNIGLLYRIIPVKGDSWVCNDVHILTLRDTRDSSNIIDIQLNDYMVRNKSFKRLHKMFRVGVEFEEKKLSLSPYFVGIWLGDGDMAGPRIHKNEKAIRDECYSVAEAFGLHVNERKDPREDCVAYSVSGTKNTANPVMEELRYCIENSEKRIPEKYLRNSRANRLQILAGLIDTDGHLHNKTFEISTKFIGLRDDILYLARSLGFAAYSSDKVVKGKTYYRINISGETSEIPTRIERKRAEKRLQIKDVTNTGFSVEYQGRGDYYGFEIDGDGRFLLGDFTVTHNTTVLSQLSMDYAKQGVPTLWGSFEIKNVKLAKTMIRQFSKRNFESNLQDFDAHADAFMQLPIYFTSFFGFTPLDELLNVIRYAVKAIGVTHVCLDNLQFMCNGGTTSNWQDEFQVQGKVLTALRALATQQNIHITLVIHPRKQDTDGKEIGVNDIFGRGQATQEADNIVILQSLDDNSVRYIDIKKNRDQGILRKIHYKFDDVSRLITELSTDEKSGIVSSRSSFKGAKGIPNRIDKDSLEIGERKLVSAGSDYKNNSKA